MDKKAIIEALRDKPQLGRPDIKGIPRRVTDAVNRNIATLLGTPVDAVTNAINLGIAGAGTLGHKLGLVSTPPNVIESPIGGSEWFGQQMEQRGMVSPERNTYNEVMAGLLMPAATTRAAKTLFNAEQQAARNIAAPDTLNTPGFRGQRGAIVWHGSPHKFDAFDASKIGTGEGAQAYGHGMYFAESPDVAKGYRDLLTKSDKQFYIKGKRVEPELLDSFQSNVLNAKGYGRNKQDYLDELEMNRVSSGAIQKISKIWDEMGDVNVKEVLPENASLYKVDLPDETIARMLDWDKPLKEQPANVQKFFSAIYKPNDYLTDWLKQGDPDDIAKILQEEGIPGIRYLDQGSRATGGTSNFVVFPGEERLLRILERNNQPMGLMGVK